MKTNAEAKFLQLVDKHFPKTNPLSKVNKRRVIKEGIIGEIIVFHDPVNYYQEGIFFLKTFFYL